MKSKLWGIVGIIAAVILAGCGAPVSTGILDNDWCWIFDFTKNPQGFLITSGTWTSQGILSDATGLLQTSYGYNRDVYPDVVRVTVVRPAGVEGEIAVTAAGTIFGMSAGFTAPFPADLDIAQLTFQRPTSGEEIIGDLSAVNITVDATLPVGISQIYVGGSGSSSFPQNLCEPATPTPLIDINGTGTPTPVSPTPSPTPTGTWESPTPSPTPEIEEWICTYEGASLETQILPYFGGAAWTGTGWTSNPSSTNRINIQGNVTGRYIYDIIVYMTAPPGGDANVIRLHDVGNPAYRAQIGASLETVIPVNSVLNAWYFDIISNWSGSGAPITGEVYKLTFTGTGDEIPGTDCDEPTPTPGPSDTPAPSPTMGPTNTPEPLWSACLDFTSNNYSYQGIDAIYDEGVGWIQDAGEWSVGRAGQGPSQKKQLKFVFNGPWAGSVRAHALVGTDATGWILGVGPEFFIDLSEEDWIPTQNFRFEFDGSYGPYALEKICWIDLAPSGTPVPGGSRTPLPTVTGTVLPSRTPIQVPAPVILITATAGMYITTTPIYSGTGVYSPSGTPSLLITGTPGAEGTPGGDGSGGTGYGSGGGGFGDVGDMIGFGWNIGWGLLNTLIAYVQQAGGMLGGLISGFTNSSPQSIPGLPLCITNPTAHDFCAIIYIIEWTILAPGTPGALIVPLLQILVGIWGAIYFVHYLLKIIDRGESVTDAP